MIETKVPLLQWRRTKVVATLGPASSDARVIEGLLLAGVNVFRLNMSHGDHDGHRANYERVREVSRRLELHTAVLADLCGPKIRVGKFRDGSIELHSGGRVTITTRQVEGEPGLIPSQYAALSEDVRAGSQIFLDDGLLELGVESVNGTEITCRILRGGVLKDKKGMNLPGVELSTPALTEKDRRDAQFAVEMGVDFLALSFVRRAADVADLTRFLDEKGWRQKVGIISKIEKPQALTEIDAILDACDGIMVARGDLGVELPPEMVPVAQDRLVDRARSVSKPVIVATQMLESMVENPRPTRAEVSDISHAVTSGTDALMLSAESAAGAYPVEAVTMMDRISRQTEGFLWQQQAFGSISSQGYQVHAIPVTRAVARSTAQLSRDLRVRGIVILSRTGVSAAMMSAARPAAPLVAISSSEEVCRRMNLLWGVIPVHRPDLDQVEFSALARQLCHELSLAATGEQILLVRGFSTDSALNEPSITVLTV